MRGTRAETPKPSAATSPAASAIAARRAITFSMPNGSASRAPRSTLASPDSAGSYGVSVACTWSGSTTTTSTSEQGTWTARVGSAPAVSSRLTCAITRPPALRAASARSRVPSGAASCSMETLPRASALVPRMIATSGRSGRKVQPFGAVEFDHAHEVLARRAIHSGALAARIDEGVEADLRENAGGASRGAPQHVEDQAARQVVRFDRVLEDQPPDRRHRQRRGAARIAAGDHALQKARPGEMVDAGDAVHVPGADRMYRGQSARPALARETLADRLQHPVRRVQAARRADRHDRAVRDQPRGVVRTHRLSQRQPHLPTAGSASPIMARIGPPGDPAVVRRGRRMYLMSG